MVFQIKVPPASINSKDESESKVAKANNKKYDEIANDNKNSYIIITKNISTLVKWLSRPLVIILVWFLCVFIIYPASEGCIDFHHLLDTHKIVTLYWQSIASKLSTTATIILTIVFTNFAIKFNK